MIQLSIIYIVLTDKSEAKFRGVGGSPDRYHLLKAHICSNFETVRDGYKLVLIANKKLMGFRWY